jgi:hypothetical protein
MTDTPAPVFTDPKTFDYWRARLAGQNPPVVADEPHSGYYRGRRKGGEMIAVAYWYDSHTGELRCHVNGADEKELRAKEMWPFVAAKPIPAELYKAVVVDGKPWPDVDASLQGPQPGTVYVDGADILVATKAELARMVAAAQAYTAEISSDDEASRVQSVRAALNKVKGDAEDFRDTERAPHGKIYDDITAKWKPIIEVAHDTGRLLRDMLDVWVNKKDAAAKAKHEAAKTAAAETGQNAPVQMPVQQGPVRTGGGRAAAVKTKKVGTIVDQDLVYQTYREEPKLIELLQQLVNKSIKDGFDEIPGVSIESKKSVS